MLYFTALSHGEEGGGVSVGTAGPPLTGRGLLVQTVDAAVRLLYQREVILDLLPVDYTVDCG